MRYVFTSWILFFSLFVIGQSEFERYWVISGKGDLYIKNANSIDTFYLDDTMQIRAFDIYNKSNSYIEFSLLSGRRMNKRWELGLSTTIEYQKKAESSIETAERNDLPARILEQLESYSSYILYRDIDCGFYIKYFLLNLRHFEFFIQTMAIENYYYYLSKENSAEDQALSGLYTTFELSAGCTYILNNRLQVVANFGNFHFRMFYDDPIKKYQFNFLKIPIGVVITF